MPTPRTSSDGLAPLLELARSGVDSATVLSRTAELFGVEARQLTELLQLVSFSPDSRSSGHADVQTVIDEETNDQDRVPALRRLSFAPDSAITVLALLGSADDVDRVVTQLRDQAAVQHSTLGGVNAVLIGGARGESEFGRLQLPLGLRGGYSGPSAALAAPESWRHARNALRFALPSRLDGGAPNSSVLVDASQLGPYEVLAEQLSVNQMARIRDVERLDELVRVAGSDMLDTLLAVAATDSLRQAARTLHLHHNSVAHRVERAQRAFDFPLTEPYGRARLLLILTLHRLVASNTLF